MRPLVDHVGSPSSPGDAVRRRTSDPAAFTVYRSSSNVAGLSRLEAKTRRELLPVAVGVSSLLLHAARTTSEVAAQHTVNTRRELRTKGVMVERVGGSGRCLAHRRERSWGSFRSRTGGGRRATGGCRQPPVVGTRQPSLSGA